MKKFFYTLIALICIHQNAQSEARLDWKVSTLSQPVAARYGIQDRRNIVLVTEVGDGPILSACIHPGDVILEIDGKTLEYSTDVYQYDKLPPGSDFSVKIWRNSTREIINYVVSTERSSDIDTKQPVAALGILIKNIYQEQLNELGIKNRLSSIMVRKTIDGSNVSKAGLKEGDIIIGLNGQPLMMACEFQKKRRAMKDGQQVELELFQSETQQIRKISFKVQATKEFEQGFKQFAEDDKNAVINSAKKKIPFLKIEASAGKPDLSGKVEFKIKTSNKLVSLKINDAEEGGSSDLERTIYRFAPVGKSTFRVEFNDEFGQVVTRNFAIERLSADKQAFYSGLNPLDAKLKGAGRDVVALVIGIEGYKNAPPAAFAEADANVFAEYLKTIYGVKPGKMKVLTGTAASRIEIIKSLKTWLPGEVKAGSTEVIVFYAGHGLASEDGKFSYLLPHDSDANLLDDTGLKLDDVLSAVQKLNPKVANFFVDSCYSGQDRTGDSLVPSARPITIKSAQTAVGVNTNMLTSSSVGQFSVSIPEAQHGLFSYFLMKGMGGDADRDGNKKITLAELSEYLNDKISREAVKLGKSQRPVFQGKGDFVLVGD